MQRVADTIDSEDETEIVFSIPIYDPNSIEKTQAKLVELTGNADGKIN